MAQKEASVAELTKNFEDSTAVLLTEYRCLTVAKLLELDVLLESEMADRVTLLLQLCSKILTMEMVSRCIQRRTTSLRL